MRQQLNADKLNWSGHCPENITQAIINIYGDNYCTLKGNLENNCNINFLIHEHEDTKEMADATITLPEHFGLMIITRACNSFLYEFDVDTCTNNFIATINTGENN